MTHQRFPEMFAQMQQRRDRARRHDIARNMRAAIVILILGAVAGFLLGAVTTLAAEYPAILAEAHDRAKG